MHSTADMNNTVGSRPLYKQVYDSLANRISEGDWKPAQSLPSEFALAAELGVSQGTVRKALTELETDKVVERRQGKGTFVSEHTDEDSNFRFFRLTRRDGSRLMPTGKIESIHRRPANRLERTVFGFEESDDVIEICRLRIVDDLPCATENIVIPHRLFPDIEKSTSLTTSLYPLYQREFGIHVVNAEEQLRSEIANKQQAKRLKAPIGTPLLRVDRIAHTIHGQAVERRTSRLDTRNYSYSVMVN